MALLALAMHGVSAVWPIYLVLVGNGAVRMFNSPTGQAFLPALVRAEHFPNAVAWSASVFTAATILGPMTGGLLYGFTASPAPVYACAAAGYLTGLVSILLIRVTAPERPPASASVSTVLEGLRYIWHTRMILGAISLDLFAVLLGGAVALLPVYAQDRLHVGAGGLGLLRSSPGVGAMIMAVVVAYRPVRRRAGAAMLWFVAGFGVFTIVFGLSRNLLLSMAALALVGACDMVSVVVRQTMIQLATPDNMRGRVSAVNMVFVGASNEVGQFESGITAQWFGAVPAVVLGGVGTLAVVAAWAWLFPVLRRVDQLTPEALSRIR